VTQFIDHSYTQLITTSNYSAFANLHTLQIIRAHAKSFQSASISRFPVTDLNNRNSSASVLMSLPTASYSTTQQTHCQSQSQSHIATDGQSVSLGVEPHLRLMTRYLFLFDSYSLVIVERPL
jgi:hypothetical protein